MNTIWQWIVASATATVYVKWQNEIENGKRMKIICILLKLIIEFIMAVPVSLHFKWSDFNVECCKRQFWLFTQMNLCKNIPILKRCRKKSNLFEHCNRSLTATYKINSYKTEMLASETTSLETNGMRVALAKLPLPIEENVKKWMKSKSNIST